MKMGYGASGWTPTGTGAVGNSTGHLWGEWAQAPAMRMAPQMASHQRLQVEDVRLAMIPLKTLTIFRNAVSRIPERNCHNLTIQSLGKEASTTNRRRKRLVRYLAATRDRRTSRTRLVPLGVRVRDESSQRRFVTSHGVARESHFPFQRRLCHVSP